MSETSKRGGCECLSFPCASVPAHSISTVEVTSMYRVVYVALMLGRWRACRLNNSDVNLIAFEFMKPCFVYNLKITSVCWCFGKTPRFLGRDAQDQFTLFGTGCEPLMGICKRGKQILVSQSEMLMT